MKKNILLAFCCCSLLAFTACSDDYNDATSKHVYGENENPYLKIDTEAQISATGALEVNGEHSYTVKLSDYAAKFEEKMGMSVDAVIDGLSTGETVFYPINTTRNQWLKTPYNKDDAGWYFNSANQPCAQDDEACKASVVLDKTNKELVFELTEGGITAGTVLALEVGFAKNGPDYDNYVRFTLNASVTDPTVAVATVELPNTDYTADDILLTSIEENIAAVFEMTLDEFITAFDEGTIKFYAAFNSISDSMTKTVPKEIKMTNEVVFTESTPLISKDIYRTYRHCRNIEISHLWQYSISPITFIVFCLSAYGYLPV
jgi:hypothetical protein